MTAGIVLTCFHQPHVAVIFTDTLLILTDGVHDLKIKSLQDIWAFPKPHVTMVDFYFQ